MIKLLTSILTLMTIIHLANAQNENQIVIGTEHILHSNILDEDREYWLSLPASYHSENSSYKKYPILIVLDGNSHFRPISGIVDYMSSGSSGNRRIPEMIVVGIKNVNRNRDYTPDKIITKRKNDFGGGDNFLSFLEDELIPKLDQEYRTAPYRILYGHSLGGLLSTHTYMKEKTLFNSFIAVDPSFGSWDPEKMDEKIEAMSTKSLDRFIYIATANWGDRNVRNGDRHARLYEILSSEYGNQFKAELEYFENENHGSVPLIAFHNGINSIFSGYGISYRDINTKEQLVLHFQAVSERLSYDFVPPEALVNRMGYAKLRSSNEEDLLSAINFFQLNTQNFPYSFNAFDSLGEAYEAMGDKKNAVDNYKKSLELNPKNEHAQSRIENLK